MKITMDLPKTIFNIVKVINEKLEIVPEKDKIISISLWDFRDENEDLIPKRDLKNGLRKLEEDEKILQLKDIQCLDKLGRFASEKIELKINRKRFKKFYKERYSPYIKKKLPEVVIKTDQTEDVKKIPYRIPAGTKWEDIEMKFKNEFEVEIFIKGKFSKVASYEELGLYRSGTKDKRPDVQWHFLTILSVCQEQDKTQATIDNMASSLGKYLNKKVSREMCEQIKSKLSKKLQEKFGIDEEPFYPYKEYNFYQPKFKLKPVPLLRGNGEPFITKTPYDDTKRYSSE